MDRGTVKVPEGEDCFFILDCLLRAVQEENA
jgi:hypothetical protein